MKNYKKIKHINSFSINVKAKDIITISTEKELFLTFQYFSNRSIPVLILGEGSNTLFLKNYSGIILLNRILGITFRENSKTWYLHARSGEKWKNLVKICIEKKISGLENLSFIPGCVGSAPVQNIGAYGLELKNICEYVDILQLETAKKIRLSAEECKFSYRNSIFSRKFRKKYAIVAVGIKLSKSWKPILNYDGLSHLNINTVTPRQIYQTISYMRKKKLPNPKLIGNAGSFFKNPIFSKKRAKHLLKYYPNIPIFYQEDDTVKSSAGWMIKYCGLSGYQIGGAKVHDKQTSILLNVNNAESNDIVHLANYIRKKIVKKFDVILEPEVKFIDENGEVDSSRIMK